MNVNAPRRGNTKVNYRQMIIFGVMALAAIYHFSRPTLEKWTGRSLPAIVNDDRSASNHSGNNDQDHDYDVSFESNGGQNLGKAARAWLKQEGNQFRSPAGLKYSGNNIDHVLLHCKDNTSKPTHGIFVGGGAEVMQMVDEAYEKVKSGDRSVDSEKSRGRMTHIVSMGRVVGHTGGQKAKKRGRDELRKIKLVLDGDRVITAFPKN